MAKPRDRKAEAARRNERARAAGFDSYGQGYRGAQQGYRDAGYELKAARKAAASTGAKVQRVPTKAGVVLSARVNERGGTASLLRALKSEMKRTR